MNRLRWVGPILALFAVGFSTQRALSGSAERYHWEHDETQAGVSVYTSAVPDHAYDAIKATTTFALPVQALFGVLRDFERYPRWYHRCAQVRVLREPAATASLPVREDGQLGEFARTGPWLLFFQQHTPPLDDRWAVLRCEYRPGPDHSLWVEFHALEQYAFDAPESAVRMSLRGYWQLQPLAPARTRVTFMLDVDPRTSAPAFLVDPVLRETVVQTLRDLQRETVQRKLTDQARGAAL
jgi:ribosome-associated toxin RatA of RatAB toxin-antitoxin module